MPWPLSQDYNEAIQNPSFAFHDAELKGGQAATNAIGLPAPRSGNFADVYEVNCPATGNKWAVKCFTREVAGLQERYSEISAHLKQVKLPFTVDFQYLADGIRVQSKWYPILKMRWVKGFLLNEFVKAALDKPATLDALVQLWTRMAKPLREANVAHGDLQHGNILLVPGAKGGSLSVRLIDYDGMWVPTLAGRRSGEVGHPNFQHPQRLYEGTYSPHVDRFGFLLVATALTCVKVGGRVLWDRYNNGDNLLFKEADFAASHQSPLFAELLRLGDPLARSLAARLMAAAQEPLDQTPLLEELFPDKTAIPTAPRSPVALAREGSLPAGPSGPSKPAKDRGLLVLLGGAVVLLCGMGVATLSFMGSWDEPNTASLVVKGQTAPKIDRGQKVQYLSDMQEFDVKVAEKRFGKGGRLGYSAGGSDRIMVNGWESVHGLSMCPNPNANAGAKYKLANAAHTFIASVALNDSAGAPGGAPGEGKIPTPLTFLALGDGKLLWESRPVDIARSVQGCTIDVTRVDVLELRVDCPGTGVNAQPVWLEPRVLLK